MGIKMPKRRLVNYSDIVSRSLRQVLEILYEFSVFADKSVERTARVEITIQIDLSI